MYTFVTTVVVTELLRTHHCCTSLQSHWLKCTCMIKTIVNVRDYRQKPLRCQIRSSWCVLRTSLLQQSKMAQNFATWLARVMIVH
jgi:hypothetical protein